MEVIDQKKEDRREKYNSNIVHKISLGAVGTGMAACIGALIASVVYGIKEDKEEKRKKKLLTNMPGVIAPIKKVKYKSETQICKDMLDGITHNDDTSQNCGYSHITTTEKTQENQNTLNK